MIFGTSVNCENYGAKKCGSKPGTGPGRFETARDTFTKNVGFTPNVIGSSRRVRSRVQLMGRSAQLLEQSARREEAREHRHRCLRSEWLQLLPDGSRLYGRTYGRPMKSFSLGKAMPATRRPVCAPSHRDPRQVSDADLKAVRDAGLHGCERHGDRRGGGHVLPDEVFR
jgi:hypothetical protein